MRSFALLVLFLASSVGVWTPALAEQAQAPAPRQASPREWRPPALVPVRPIRPPATPLPPESASAAVTTFSFIVYGDTRCDCRIAEADSQLPPKPETEADHAAVVEALVAKAKELSRSRFPVRFVLQSGDATYRGSDAGRWNDVFIPIVERITQGANLPFFFVPGNHDVTSSALPPTDPDHALGLHNTLSAISKLIPPEGSLGRLSGYATFSFGYGNVFVIGLDSNIAGDLLQLAWVTDQLERLDRARYAHVVVVFHHPPITSGRYSGVPSTVVLPNGLGASGGSVGPEALAIQQLYMPLFRKHHVRLVMAGHDHLFDHWVERYTDAGSAYRLDHIVSGGGGAPGYIYTGEPDLKDYLAAGTAQNVRLEHLAHPEATVDANPNHFLVIQVDGQKLTVEVVASRGRRYMPYNGQARMELSD